MEVPMKRTDTAKPQEKFLLFIQRPRSLPVYWKRNAGKLHRIFLKKEGGLIRVSGKPLPKIFPVDQFCSCRFTKIMKNFTALLRLFLNNVGGVMSVRGQP